MNDIKESQERETLASFQAAAGECVQELKSDIPGWNDALYNNLMDYAIENGAKEDEIVKCVDPSIFKMLHKARQFDSGKAVVKARVRKATGSPKKVVKSGGRTKAPNKNMAIIKKIDAGEFDSDVFNALED